MKHIFIFCFCLFFFNHLVKGQFGANDTFEGQWKANGSQVMVFNDTYDGIEGDPYYCDTWSIGSIEMLSNFVFEGIEMKYDMLEDNVLVKDKSGKHILPIYGSVKSFYYTDDEGREHKFLNLSPTYGNSGYTGFYKLLYDGEIELLVKRKVYMHHVESKQAYSSNRSYDEFRDYPPVYLLVDGQNKVVEFKRGKKSVLSALGEHKALVKYTKDNKLNLKNDKGIIQLITYFDTLQK